MDRHDARLLAGPARYLDTYWSRFPDIWVHGDWAAIDEDGLWYILGARTTPSRSRGKRLGPAEVESLLVEHPAVIEAAAIGVPDALKGQALVCFCVLRRPARRCLACRVARRLWPNRLGKPLQPDDRVRDRPAEDAQRESHAPRHSRARHLASHWAICQPSKIHKPSRKSRDVVSAFRRTFQHVVSAFRRTIKWRSASGVNVLARDDTTARRLPATRAGNVASLVPFPFRRE